MPRQVAFLRGINLGGRRVRMERLREIFTTMGFEDAQTFIASGNVVFDVPAGAAPELEGRIEAALSDALGYDVATFVRSLERVGRIAERALVPEEATDVNAHVVFLRAAPGSEVGRALRALQTPDDTFLVEGREAFWLRRGRLSETRVPAADLARALGGADNTMRNMNTLRRIAAKFAEA